MDQHRRLVRKHLATYPRVLDRDTGVAIGRLADLSVRGIMVVGEEPIELGVDFSLALELPEPIEGRPTIELEARSLWSRPAPNPKLKETGFEITQSTDQGGRMISRLIMSLGLTE